MKVISIFGCAQGKQATDLQSIHAPLKSITVRYNQSIILCVNVVRRKFYSFSNIFSNDLCTTCLIAYTDLFDHKETGAGSINVCILLTARLTCTHSLATLLNAVRTTNQCNVHFTLGLNEMKSMLFGSFDLFDCATANEVQVQPNKYRNVNGVNFTTHIRERTYEFFCSLRNPFVVFVCSVRCKRIEIFRCASQLHPTEWTDTKKKTGI